MYLTHGVPATQFSFAGQSQQNFPLDHDPISDNMSGAPFNLYQMPFPGIRQNFNSYTQV
jgi:hypothetical protein